MRLRGGRTGKRAVVAEHLGSPASGAVRSRGLVRRSGRGARVERLGQVALPAAARPGGTDPDGRLGHVTTTGEGLSPVAHTGRAVLGARVVPGLFAQTHGHPEFVGRTLLDILTAATTLGRDAEGCRELGPRPLRARRARRSRRSRRCRAVSRRGSRSCCSSSRARRCCCSTSRPTTSTSFGRGAGGRARGFEGTVLAVTHDRWFAGRSTGSSCSAPTAASSNPTRRSGTRSRVLRALSADRRPCARRATPDGLRRMRAHRPRGRGAAEPRP